MKTGLPFRILVVDDDSDDRVILDDAFDEIDYDCEVKKFNSGKMLLRYLEQVEPSLLPSLIVLDNTLPELDAVDLLAILKTKPAFKEIPVVIYTTSLSPARRQQLLSKGAYACYEKGNTMQEIVEMAKQLRQLAEDNTGHHNKG
jgi:CheY-like chemotaxis protein